MTFQSKNYLAQIKAAKVLNKSTEYSSELEI